MSRHADPLRLLLGQRPMTARQLVENTGLSQPTVSRALAQLGDEVVRFGSGASIQYAIRAYERGLTPLFPVIPAKVSDTKDHGCEPFSGIGKHDPLKNQSGPCSRCIDETNRLFHLVDGGDHLVVACRNHYE